MKLLFVRELSDRERHALRAGLRSSDGFRVRRCHILLASARGDTAPVIAQAVGCSPQAVRNVLRGFETMIAVAPVGATHKKVTEKLEALADSVRTPPRVRPLAFLTGDT